MVVADGSEAQAPRPQYGQVSPARGGAVPGTGDAGSGEGLSGWARAGGRALGLEEGACRPHGGHQAARHLPGPAPRPRPGGETLRAAATGQVRAHLGAANPQPLLSPSSPRRRAVPMGQKHGF